MNIRVSLHDEIARRSIEDAIERLLGLLDGFDPDPDLEPDNDDEPGTWTEFMQSRGHCSVDDENLEDGHDAEPEETDCDLAGASTDLEGDDGESDGPSWSDHIETPQMGARWHGYVGDPVT